MAIPDKHLNDGEDVVLDLHPHWWFLTPRGLLLIVSMILGALAWNYSRNHDEWYRTGVKYAAFALLAVSLVLFVIRLFQWRTTDFIITTERCIYRSGVIAKAGIEIPLDRINTVFFNQSIFERMLRAGDLGIESAGENSRQEFANISDPSIVQKTIYSQMEAYELRRQDRLGDVLRANSPVPAAAAPPTIPEQLNHLDELRQRGVLTEEEFAAKKTELLERM